MAELRTLRLTDGGNGFGTVTLGGTDVSNAVRAVTIRCEVNHLPQVELDLVVDRFDVVAEATQVCLPAATRQLLIELGWTPPEEG